MNLISLKSFLLKYDLSFKTEKSSVVWLKRNLKPSVLLKIGENYMVNEDELRILLEDWVKTHKLVARNKLKEKAPKAPKKQEKTSKVFKKAHLGAKGSDFVNKPSDLGVSDKIE